MCVLFFARANPAAGGHPGSGGGGAHEQHAGEQEMARHAAVFTTFCDTGSIEAGSCWCKGGSATAAIGDGSWLWRELMGEPCAALPDDRCDCTSCGGSRDDCPHGPRVVGGSSCWQCQGVNAPQCNPPDSLKRCEVSVHGTHGVEKYYITEVCPSAHPCNRCKEASLQRCAQRHPLAIDLCGTTWGNVFERSRAEADGFVTLSCYPDEYVGEEVEQAAVEAEEESEAAARCESHMAGDVPHATCEPWCSVQSAADHCQWCKCRGCAQLADACAAVVKEMASEQAKRAALFSSCGRRLDCLSWCNMGNCQQ